MFSTTRFPNFWRQKRAFSQFDFVVRLRRAPPFSFSGDSPLIWIAVLFAFFASRRPEEEALPPRFALGAALCFTFAAGAAAAGAAAACDDDDDEEGGVPAAVHSDRHETWIII